MLRARRDRRGDDQYLRRQLAGDRLIWRESTAWEKALRLTLATLVLVALATALLTHIDLVTWLALGVFSGQLVGYPHWRAHWQRLHEVAARDEQSRVAMLG